MKLYIPALGDVIELTQPWTFKLRCERRNKSLWDLCSATKMDSIPYTMRGGYAPVESFLPKGTRLVVERVFVRKGSSTFNSVTFRCKVIPFGDDKVQTVRFWVSLKDANNIYYKFTRE